MEIYLIRHGMTIANKSKRYVGRTDLPVIEEGFEEIKSYISKNIYPDVDKIYSSPMQRCRQTTELIFPGKEYEIVDDFIEMDFGLFENLTYDEIVEKYGDSTEAFVNFDFPQGENMEDFTKRCNRAFTKILDKNTNCVIVCHGGVIMSLMAIYGIPRAPFYSWFAGNALGYKIIFDEGRVKEVAKIEV